jgi:signal transduction histidine kinase
MRFTPIKNDGGEVTQIINVSTDITESYRARQELEKSYEKERELTHLQSRFITTMSHEFRTPLTIINTSAELLSDYFDRLTEERRKQHLLKMRVQIQHITEMLDDILTTGQFEAERIPFNPTTFDLNAFCMEVINDLQHTASAHKLILQAEANPCTQVVLDQKLTTRIVYNLLSNAIKYSPDGGAITLSLKCDADSITLQVQDQGIGMSEDDSQQLFERFHRGDNISNISGTGLGMYIVKQAVDLHDGTIAVVSELDKGTTITINMPRQH